MRKKIVAGTAVVMGIIAILLSSLFVQVPSYAAYVRSLPTGNAEATFGSPPNPIPGIIITGKYIRIGVNRGGTFGVGQKDPGTGFQYPIGPQFESLAWAWWGEGYVIAYKTKDDAGKWVDHVAYWQPEHGWPPPGACNIVPVSQSLTRNDTNFGIVKTVVGTADKVLEITFEHQFQKHMKYVELKTMIRNNASFPIRDLIYKRFVDWDIHQVTPNDWSSDSHSAYASYFNRENETRYVFTVAGWVVQAGNRHVSYVDLYGWDDQTTRDPFKTVQSPDTLITSYDGAAMITFDLGPGNRNPGTSVTTFLNYQASETLYLLG